MKEDPLEEEPLILWTDEGEYEQLPPINRNTDFDFPRHGGHDFLDGLLGKLKK